MFESYSDRARHIIFLARVQAGARGAQAIEVDDLLAALILEDQNKIHEALDMVRDAMDWPRREGQYASLKAHEPFLASQEASTLLEAIQLSQARSQPIASHLDMPISTALSEALVAATALREKLHSRQVTPLHILAVTLSASEQRAEDFRKIGVTEENILGEIRKQAEP